MRLLHLIAAAWLTTALAAAQDLIPFVQGLNSPLFMTHAGDGSGRLFIVERPGRILIWRNGIVLGQPFLDISQRVRTDVEFGLLGLAFHPDYENNGRFFVYYSPSTGPMRTLVAEFRRSAQDPDLAVDSETVLLSIPQPAPNHNGGMMAFGPDGMLYISLGDGGGGGDPFENGQDLGDILGSVIRLDVDGPSLIPPDNPFAGTPGARGEIWAYGLRNPWRFSFDRQTGRLFLGDVGQNRFEEVDIIERGGNYGWDIMEASACFEPSSGCDMSGLILPIHEYGRSDGRSITGGYVYRGQRFPDLQGRYLFGDFVSGRGWTLRQNNDGSWARSTLFNRSDILLASFAEDEQGELYVIDLQGRIFELAQQGPDLAMDKSHTGTFQAGETGEYRLTVRNVGNTTSGTPITLNDTLPPGLVLNRIETSSWSCLDAGPEISCIRDAGLPPDTETVVRLFVDVLPSAVPEVVNSATVASPGDANPDNDSDSDPTTVIGRVDLEIEAQADQPFVEGFEAVYEVTVRNVGEIAALQPVNLTIELPQDVTPLSAESQDWECQDNASPVQCSLDPPFIRDGQAFLTLRVLLGSGAPPSVEALFQVDSPEDDNPANDSVTLRVPVAESANLAVQAHLENPLQPASQTPLTISLSGSTVEGFGARITSELPQGTSFVAFQGQDWQCADQGATVTCLHPPIQPPDPQQSEQLVLMLEVSPQAQGLLFSRVVLEAEFDAFSPDNQSVQAVAVAQAGDSDGDGIPDLEEDGVWPDGDGNGDGVPDRLQSSVASLLSAAGAPVALVAEGAALASVSAQQAQEPETLQLNGLEPSIGAFDLALVDLTPTGNEASRSGVFLISDRSLGNQALLAQTALPFPRPAGQEGAEIGTHSLFLAFIDGGTLDADSQEDGAIRVEDLSSETAENAPRVSFFPQVGDGTPLPVRFQTEINLLNSGSQGTARLDFRQSSSLAMLLQLEEMERESQLDIALPSGGTFTAQSQGSGAPDDASLQVGYARLVARPGIETVLVFRRSDARQEVILYEAGIPATQPLREATVFVDSLGVRQTGVAILNPPEVIPSQGDDFLIPQVPALAAEVRLELRGLDFQLLAETVLTLADGEQRAAFVEELFDQAMPSPAEELQGLLVIRSDRPVAVLGLRQSDRPGVEFPADVATLAPLPVSPGIFQPEDPDSISRSPDK